MSDELAAKALELEQELIAALRDPSAAHGDLRRRLDSFPRSARFVSCKEWLGIAADVRLGCWRRLTALQIAIDRCISFPCELGGFTITVLAPLAADQQPFIDLSIEQNLPFERHPDEKVYVAPIPIDTSIGRAGLYFALSQASPSVMRAAVYPAADSCRDA